MMRTRCALSGLLVLGFTVFLGCGGDQPATELSYEEACRLVPGCSEPRFDRNASKETVYRALIVREESGGVRIESVDTVDVSEGNGVPIAPLGGTHLLVGLNEMGVAVDGQEIRFPDVLQVSREDAFDHGQVDLSGREVDVVGYVRALPAVAELGIVDESGVIVARAALPLSTNAKAGNAVSKVAQASPHCSHVRLLEGEADREMARNMAYYGETELIEPGPTQRAVIEGALGRMTPMLCHAISRIAVGRIAGAPGVGGVVAQLSGGDLVLLNTEVGYRESDLVASEEARLRMMQTLIHETAHATEAILNSEGMTSQTFSGEWSFASRTVASDTVHNVRLERGLLIEWQRTHFSFLNQGWALPYPSTDGEILGVRSWDAQKTAESGFMSRYGASSYAEDIAETTAWAYMGPLFGQAGIPEGRREKEDFGCQIMGEHHERSVPGRLSAIYTKLLFLKDLGMIHPEDADACTGPELGLPIDSPGFHIWQDTLKLRSFEQAVTAAIGTASSGRRVFEMRAQGEAGFGDQDYPAAFRMQLDLAEGARELAKVPWPRGVYPLALTGDTNFELRLDGAASGNFDVSDGFVLVAEASNSRIAGSVFITRVWRLNAPIPVPEVYDPPLTVRFLIEN